MDPHISFNCRPDAFSQFVYQKQQQKQPKGTSTWKRWRENEAQQLWKCAGGMALKKGKKTLADVVASWDEIGLSPRSYNAIQQKYKRMVEAKQKEQERKKKRRLQKK